MSSLPGYAIVGVLSEDGHSGTVWLERNQATQQLVAIKEVDSTRLDIPAESLTAEAEAMAAVEHENLVGIKHAALNGNDLVLVMEYFEDGSWQDRYGGRPAPVAEAIDVVRDVCSGLRAFHRAGFVHRDIRPANIFLRGDTGVLGDFGLAGKPGETGSLAYVPHTPPEFRKHGLVWTQKADVYALGMTLYRMLCGHEYVDLTDPVLLQNEEERKLPRLDRWPLHIHRSLRQVIRKATKPRPSQRTPTVEDFHRDLERARPEVSFAEVDNQLWEGAQSELMFRVEISRTGDGHIVTTKKDKGSGFRKVSHKSEHEPMELAAAERCAHKILNDLAKGKGL